MGRPKGSANVTEAERLEVRRLFRLGVRVADIVAQTGRSEAVVYRITRHLTRKRPPPPRGKHAARDLRIVQLVGKGRTHAYVAERFGLSPRQVGNIVAQHPVVAALLAKGWKPAKVGDRFRLSLGTVRKIASAARRDVRHLD